MSDRKDLEAIRALEMAERTQYEREQMGWGGNSSNLYSEYLRSKRETEFTREDKVSIEAMEIMTIFLRGLFKNHDVLFWRGTSEGLTDVDKSKIIIESVLSPMQRDDMLRKPCLYVMAGPATMPELVLGSVKHQSFSRGTKTMTGLAAGTCQIIVSAALPYQSLTLANMVLLAIRTHWDYLCSQRWHAITEVAMGGFDPNNPIHNQLIRSSEHVAVTPVTFTFYHQWMTKVAPRPDAARLAGLWAAGYGLEIEAPQGIVGASTVKDTLVVYADGQIPED